MGTEYKILTDSSGIEVSIGEMSNKLELIFNNPNTGIISYTEDMPPEEMLKAFMEGIKSISYWMEEEEFNKIFSKLEVYPY